MKLRPKNQESTDCIDTKQISKSKFYIRVAVVGMGVSISSRNSTA